MQKIIISFVLSCCIFPQKETWASTRFEKFWYSTVHEMKFRYPFTFMPFNIKIGYFKYGGDKYWEQWDKVISNSETYNSNPIIFDGVSSFDEISKPKNRTMIVSEIDLLKYNFFKEKQNIVDVQFGIGYKFMKSINGFSHNAKFFKPKIQEYNINTTFALQLHKNRYYTLYYSIGKAYADLYELNSNYIKGEGINQSIGFGLHFLNKRENKKSLSHHGFEIRFNKININDVDDPVTNIKAFKAEQIGLMYSYGIGYGGEKSLGDEGYQNLLDNDFISAVEKFQNFKTINNIVHRDKEIDKIISFGLEQIPYQMYEKALEDYNKGYLEQALWWLNKTTPLSDDYLYKKIKQRKILIIAELLKGDFNNKTINNQIDVINDLKVYDENNIELNHKLSSLLIKKANLYLDNDNFFDSYYLYKEAIILNPDNEVVVRIKFKDFTTKVLNHAYNYLQNNNNVIAYEMLSLLSEFSNESDITKAMSDIAYNRIEDKKIVYIRERIQNILYGQKDNIKLGSSNIYLGQNYFIIVDLLGHPVDKTTKRRFDNVYDFATFKIADQDFKLFFKNKILIDIERP